MLKLIQGAAIQNSLPALKEGDQETQDTKNGVQKTLCVCRAPCIKLAACALTSVLPLHCLSITFGCFQVCCYTKVSLGMHPISGRAQPLIIKRRGSRRMKTKGFSQLSSAHFLTTRVKPDLPPPTNEQLVHIYTYGNTYWYIYETSDCKGPSAHENIAYKAFSQPENTVGIPLRGL